MSKNWKYHTWIVWNLILIKLTSQELHTACQGAISWMKANLGSNASSPTQGNQPERPDCNFEVVLLQALNRRDALLDVKLGSRKTMTSLESRWDWRHDLVRRWARSKERLADGAENQLCQNCLYQYIYVFFLRTVFKFSGYILSWIIAFKCLLLKFLTLDKLIRLKWRSIHVLTNKNLFFLLSIFLFFHSFCLLL